MRFPFERALFDAFSPFNHTKTPENADENGEFRKQFQNASFWKRSVSSMDRWKRRLLKKVTKKASYTVAAINVYERFLSSTLKPGLVWTISQNVSNSMLLQMKTI